MPSKKNSFRINAHGHLLPYPEDIPEFMKSKKLFWIDGDRKYMRQGDWSRPVTDKSFFLEEKVQWMDEHEIDQEVLITLSQLYCNGWSRQDTQDVIRFQNDFHASVVEKYRDRFIGGFVVQPAYIDDALSEIERCVTRLNMKVLCLPTHFLSQTRGWVSTAEEEVWPLWDLANQYGLAIQIHPYDGAKFIGLEDRFWRFHLIWMCAQTADHYHMFSLLDLGRRFPNVRTCFAHGNQYGQINHGRRMQGYKGRPDLFEKSVSPEATLNLENVFFDSLVHDVLSFEMLVRRQGVDSILAGLDDPYPLGEMDSVEDCYPGKVIDEGVESGIITQEQRDDIWYKNVRKWIG